MGVGGVGEGMGWRGGGVGVGGRAVGFQGVCVLGVGGCGGKRKFLESALAI